MVRGLAAIIVVISHYSNSTGLFGGLLGNGAGQIGVMLFFVLSGFLMSYLYLDRLANISEIRKFSVSRVARVMPLYIILVVVSYLFSKAEVISDFVISIPNFKVLISHLLMLYGQNVFWTIPVEMQFYCIFLMLWFIKKRPMVLLVAIVSLILISLEFGEGVGIYNKNGFLFMPAILYSIPYFFSGMFLGWAYGRRGGLQAHGRWYFGGVILIIPLLFPMIFREVFSYESLLWRDPLVFVLLNAVFFTVVFLIPETNRFYCNSCGDFLGKISYSLYLLHMPVLLFLEQHIEHNIYTYLLIFLLLTILMSLFTYRYIEKPCQNWVREKLLH